MGNFERHSRFIAFFVPPRVDATGLVASNPLVPRYANTFINNIFHIRYSIINITKPIIKRASNLIEDREDRANALLSNSLSISLTNIFRFKARFIRIPNVGGYFNTSMNIILIIINLIGTSSTQYDSMCAHRTAYEVENPEMEF